MTNKHVSYTCYTSIKLLRMRIYTCVVKICYICHIQHMCTTYVCVSYTCVCTYVTYRYIHRLYLLLCHIHICVRLNPGVCGTCDTTQICTLYMYTDTIHICVLYMYVCTMHTHVQHTHVCDTCHSIHICM